MNTPRRDSSGTGTNTTKSCDAPRSPAVPVALRRRTPFLRAVTALVAAALLAGCSSTSFDGGHATDLLATDGSPEALLVRLGHANEAFVAAPDRDVAHERGALAAKQQPPVAILACADSRCAPEWVFEQRPGRLFVVRVAGNVADPFAIASLEYAVEHLGTRLIVVLGHSGCGAVAATLKGGDPGSPSLRALVAEIEPAAAPHRGAGDDALPRAVDANALQVSQALASRSEILRHAVEKGTIRIATGVHDLATGRVRILD